MSESSEWAKDVVCPVCGGLMTLLKEKADTHWGETFTFQCHNAKPFVVMTVTTSVLNKMEPSMFDVSVVNWKEVAPKAPKSGKLKPKFKGVREIPARPWTRMTNSSVLWDCFWALYKTRGKVDCAESVIQAGEIKGDSPQLRELVRTLPDWMTQRSGYVVKRMGGDFKIVGKAES